MTDRRGLFLLAISAVVLLWVLASALSRGQGFWFFAAGLILLAGVAALAFHRRRRVLVYRVWLLLLLAAVTALLFELSLHLAPGLLHGVLANVAYTGYHWQRGGIYRLDAHRGPVLRPGVRRRLYWNGHWWWHETNHDGYRGERFDTADAVFLGDSMVYGHGVEGDQTVPARFQARSGLRSANLGQQGACMVQELLILLDQGLRLRPRLVFVCSHPTDLEEAVRYYGPAELARFTGWSAGPEGRPWVRPEYRPRPAWDPVAFWSLHVALPMRSSGILGAAVRSARAEGLRVRSRAPSRDPFVPTARDLAVRFEDLAPAGIEPGLAWRAHRHALAEIQRVCQEAGARLVLFDLGYPEALSSAVEATARELGASYSPAGRRVLERAQRGERVYLADDGHWSAIGADAMAEALLAAIAQPSGPEAAPR